MYHVISDGKLNIGVDVVSANVQQTHNPYPLEIFKGAHPPAPDWFRDAIQVPSVLRTIDVDGARVNYRQWGASDKPGLLLSHGSGAHLHWYDFIAPDFMQNFNVVAMTFSGMGDSGWRDAYSLSQYSAEQMRVLQDAGMLNHKVKPIIAAHSFGGVVTLSTAAQFGHLLKGIVIMDTPVFPPGAKIPPRPNPIAKDIFFPNQQAALARFRLMPPQKSQNPYILDYIARHSLKQVKRGDTTGWTWKFDPDLWGKLSLMGDDHWKTLTTLNCMLAFIRGEQSVFVTDEIKRNILSLIQVPFVSIKNANHHVFLDNPSETISELKTIFEAWETEEHPMEKLGL